jgi:hypothetical protein
MNIGRCLRALSARSTAPRPMIGSWLAVQLTMTSNSCSREGRSARRMASPPKRPASFSPRSSVRLAMAIDLGSLAAKCVAARSIISPAPTNSTRPAAQVFEQLAGQAHGGGGHADGVRADLGGGAHFLGDGERALEQLVQRAAQRAGGFGRAHGVFHLAEDLRFAQHHRVEPAGHAEGVARGLVVVQGVGMRAQQGRGHAAALRQPAEGVVERDVLGGAIDLRAVAGGDDRGLDLGVVAGGKGTAQALQRRGDLVERERETTAQIERRGRVVQAKSPDRHARDYKISSRTRLARGQMAFPMTAIPLAAWPHACGPPPDTPRWTCRPS